MKTRSPIWQKRFGRRLPPSVVQFTSSVTDDYELVPYEIRCSKMHVRMLRNQGIISGSDCAALLSGLKEIQDEYLKGGFRMRDEYEDVHMNVEMRLRKLCGNAADLLHTARSRNDLIGTELRMYVRDKARIMQKNLLALQKAIIDKAETFRHCIIPGLTHLQEAQPILVPYFMLSYFLKLQRDFEGFSNLIKGMTTSPLGSCAIAGTGLDIDRKYTALGLGFNAPSDNGLDAIGDRDFLCTFLFNQAQLMVHISSFCEDMIVLSASGINVVVLGSEVTTGSSIMPQKQNPDVCELLRGKSGKAIGNLVAALAILKGLPGSYNRDLQEMKSLLFGQSKETLMSLDMFKNVIRSMRFHDGKDGWQYKPQFLCSTDLIDFLVKNGWRFRRAYDIVAGCVRKAGNDIDRYTDLCVQQTGLEREMIRRILTPRFSIASKVSFGGTGIKPVRLMMTKAKKTASRNKLMLS